MVADVLAGLSFCRRSSENCLLLRYKSWNARRSLKGTPVSAAGASKLLSEISSVCNTDGIFWEKFKLAAGPASAPKAGKCRSSE